MNTKSVSESSEILSRVMLPKDANPMGFIHGGVIAKFIDEAAAVVATRHTRTMVVTKSFDQLEFHKPVFIGNLLHLKASLNMAGTTSMEIGVRMETEDMLSGTIHHVASAYLTFVSLDAEGKPQAVPGLHSESAEEQRRLAAAQVRREHRLRHHQPL